MKCFYLPLTPIKTGVTWYYRTKKRDFSWRKCLLGLKIYFFSNLLQHTIFTQTQCSSPIEIYFTSVSRSWNLLTKWSPNFQMKFNFTQHVNVKYIMLNIVHVVASCKLSYTLSSRLWSFHVLRSSDFDQSKHASLDNFP